MNDLMNCILCSKVLFEMPRIEVEGFIYCFTCAKRIVGELQNQRLEEVHNIYLNELQQWEKAECAYNDSFLIWRSAFENYKNINKPKFYLLKFILWAVNILLIYYFIKIDSIWLFFPAVVITSIVYGAFDTNAEQKIESEYRLTHPEPIFNLLKPKEGKIIEVDHKPLFYGDEIVYKIKNYREIILYRDKHICQNCGSKKISKNLEVHHVIPKNDGGINSPYNLVTLCKHCHDREKWYSHVRIYATTIEKFHTKKRRRRWY